MTDEESGKQSKDKKESDNERATVADTPDSDPRVDAGGDAGSSGSDDEEN